MSSQFVYVTYIRTTPEKLWEALTQPEFTRKYWVDTWQDCAWEKGSSWKLMIPDGRVGDAGEVLEIERPKRLVLSWRNEFIPGMREEGFSRCTMDIEPAPTQEGVVKLTLTHEMDRDKSVLIDNVSKGWPMLLASLKTLLETGAPLPGTSEWPKGI